MIYSQLLLSTRLQIQCNQPAVLPVPRWTNHILQPRV
ncbi:mCG1040529 [Mus musculus]|nr:mCG1040529 [Mus musculus]